MVLCCIFFHDFVIQFALGRQIERGTGEEGIRRIEEKVKGKIDKCRLEGQISREYNVRSRRACVCVGGVGRLG